MPDLRSHRGLVEIAIEDDGDGVPPDFLQQIQKFGWTSKTRHGTGIGLAVADLLVRKMGGQVVLRRAGKSMGDEATVFSVFLPAFRDGLEVSP